MSNESMILVSVTCEQMDILYDVKCRKFYYDNTYVQHKGMLYDLGELYVNKLQVELIPVVPEFEL